MVSMGAQPPFRAAPSITSLAAAARFRTLWDPPGGVGGRVLASAPAPLFHEGPTFLPATGEVLVTSNRLPADTCASGAADTCASGAKDTCASGARDRAAQRVEISAVRLSDGRRRTVLPRPELRMANGACTGEAAGRVRGRGGADLGRPAMRLRRDATASHVAPIPDPRCHLPPLVHPSRQLVAQTARAV